MSDVLFNVINFAPLWAPAVLAALALTVSEVQS